MIRNYLKTAWRNIAKNKTFSVINILGLAIGTAACLLLLQYVVFELSYDDFRKSTLYRISQYDYIHGDLIGQRAQTSPALSPAFKLNIPEVLRSARVVHTRPLMSDPVMRVGERSFHEERIYFADSSLLNMFSYQMIKGNADHALSEPNSVVISRSMAKKYFPAQEALGQTLSFYEGERGKSDLKVTGIFEDIPLNSHLHTDFLVSFNSLPWNLDETWDWGNFYNYIEVLPGTDPDIIKQKIAAVMQKYQGEKLAGWAKEGFERRFDLQPVRNIHLDSHLEAEAEINGSRRTVKFLTMIAFFILVIAWINYLNLTTAKSVERAREIGIRKVVGSYRQQLISQFLAESLLINFLAFLLAIAFLWLTAPAFGAFTFGHFTSLLSTGIVITAVILFFLGSFLAGIYPAFVLSAFGPLQVLKGSGKSSRTGARLRKGLVIVQFAASIILIAGTFAVRQQLRYLQTQDLGLKMDQTLIVKGPGIKDSTYRNHLNFFKNEVVTIPFVKEVAVSSSIPGKELGWGREFYRPSNPDNRRGANIIAVDEDFFNLYDPTFLAGRNFSEAYSSDREAVIFNETAIRQLGFSSPEEAIQQSVIWDESDSDKQPKKIVGVVKDFHQESLHKEVGPMVFALKRYLNAPWAGEYFSLKMNTSDFPNALKQVQERWQQAFPGCPFDSFFLNDYFNEQYRADQQFLVIFSFFAGLAIFIACLGLFGLSSYITLQRSREIGIRKALGASTQSVATLLSKDFLQLVVVASIIILPFIYIVIHHWLQNFAYRIQISWWLLLLPVLLVWFMALITVSIQTVKTALVNPSEVLRAE